MSYTNQDTNTGEAAPPGDKRLYSSVGNTENDQKCLHLDRRDILVIDRLSSYCQWCIESGVLFSCALTSCDKEACFAFAR